MNKRDEIHLWHEREKKTNQIKPNQLYILFYEMSTITKFNFRLSSGSRSNVRRQNIMVSELRICTTDDSTFFSLLCSFVSQPFHCFGVFCLLYFYYSRALYLRTLRWMTFNQLYHSIKNYFFSFGERVWSRV